MFNWFRKKKVEPRVGMRLQYPTWLKEYTELEKVEPRVGMRLQDPTWGKEYTELEIVRVSLDKKKILYKFIRIRGDRIMSPDEYSATWEYFYENIYILSDEEATG